MGENTVTTPRQATTGIIRYRISFNANPEYHGGHADLFSDELRAKIRRWNTPESRIVYFDGSRARTEEINVDYGVRSLSFELRVAGCDSIIYCKEFLYFGFCVEHPILLPPGGQSPHLAPTGDTEMISGLYCRKAEYRGNRRLLVWYTEEVAVNDPTGAVLRLEGVPGLIVQTEEIPVSANSDTVERVTVTELSFEAPPSGIFSVPPSYRKFDDIDAVRAEDRRILDTRAAEELQRHPLDVLEQDMFVGEWMLAMPKDKILLEIVREGKTEFRFRTTVLTAPTEAAGRVSVERAFMKGRLLMVEEPPNYRLYKLGNDGKRLILVGNELFTFNRHKQNFFKRR